MVDEANAELLHQLLDEVREAKALLKEFGGRLGRIEKAAERALKPPARKTAPRAPKAKPAPADPAEARAVFLQFVERTRSGDPSVESDLAKWTAAELKAFADALHLPLPGPRPKKADYAAAVVRAAHERIVIETRREGV